MKKLLIVSFTLLIGGKCIAQKDTIHLNEIEVKEFRLKANSSFKEDLIKTDSITKKGRYTLAEALRENTGIFVKSYGGNGIATLSFRGTGASQTKLYWNDLDMGSPMLGLADLSLIPLNAFDELGIQYGFASLNNSSGAIGGALSLNNLPNFNAKTNLRLQQTAASFGQYLSNIQFEHALKGIYIKTGAYYYKGENNFTYPDITEMGYPETRMQNNNYQQLGFFSNSFFRLSSKSVLSAKVWYNIVERSLAQPITGVPENADAMQDNNLNAVVAYQSFTDSSNFKINSGLVYSENSFTSGGDSLSGNNRFNSWQSRARYEKDFSKRLNLNTGLNFQLDQATAKSYDNKAMRTIWSLYAESNYKIGNKLGAILLIRQELVNQNLNPIIGSIGFYFQQSQKSKIRLNIGRNYRLPSLNDLYWQPGGNLNLESEVAHTIEGAWDFKLSSYSKNWEGNFSLCLFYSRIENWIQWEPQGNFWFAQNLREVNNVGFEFDYKSAITLGKLQLKNQLFYNYLRSSIQKIYSDGKSSTINNQLPYVPFHKGGISIGLYKNNWGISYTQNYTGQYFTGSGNEVYMPAFSLTNLSLTADDLLKSKAHLLNAAFNVNNLFDVAYQVLPYRPEPGINFSIQLTYNPRL